MSGDRAPLRERYDALVDLSTSGARGPRAYALAKFTYDLRGGGCRLAAPRPLFHDIRNPELEPRVAAGTDFWPFRPFTDFVVEGSAFPPEGAPARYRRVSASVGERRKEVDVFGRRPLRWDGAGRVAIEEPEPFDEIPLGVESAYGGLDWRVPVANAEDPEVQVDLKVDHPGLYPRNPWGMGYLVEPGEVPGMEMPHLEDPDDRLTPERLVVGDPRRWWAQPRPACLDWRSIAVFPRYVWIGLGADAWFPGPEDERMPEVRDGELPLRYRSEHQDRDPREGPHPRFYQGAPAGLMLEEAPLGANVTLVGMHPEHDSLAFRLPESEPDFEFEIEGRRERAAPRLHSVVCHPGELQVSLLWAADRPLPRPFLPSIHKHIPVSVRIDGDEAVPYEAPPTLKEEVERARLQQEVDS